MLSQINQQLYSRLDLDNSRVVSHTENLAVLTHKEEMDLRSSLISLDISSLCVRATTENEFLADIEDGALTIIVPVGSTDKEVLNFATETLLRFRPNLISRVIRFILALFMSDKKISKISDLIEPVVSLILQSLKFGGLIAVHKALDLDQSIELGQKSSFSYRVA